jgi:hypothetical protein
VINWLGALVLLKKTSLLFFLKISTRRLAIVDLPEKSGPSMAITKAGIYFIYLNLKFKLW